TRSTSTSTKPSGVAPESRSHGSRRCAEACRRESAMKRTAWAEVAVLAWAAAAPGQVPVLSGSAQNELAGDLRGLLLKNLPDPLYEANRDWGRQAEARRLLLRGKARGDGTREMKNDGLWQEIRVDAVNPNETLV